MSKVKYLKYGNANQINFANLEVKMADDVCIILGVINGQYFYRLTKVSYNFNDGNYAFVSIKNSSYYCHGWGTLESQVQEFMEQIGDDSVELLVFSDLQNYLEYLLEGVKQEPNERVYEDLFGMVERIINYKNIRNSAKVTAISKLLRGFNFNE